MTHEYHYPIIGGEAKTSWHNAEGQEVKETFAAKLQIDRLDEFSVECTDDGRYLITRNIKRGDDREIMILTYAVDPNTLATNIVHVFASRKRAFEVDQATTDTAAAQRVIQDYILTASKKKFDFLSLGVELGELLTPPQEEVVQPLMHWALGATIGFHLRSATGALEEANQQAGQPLAPELAKTVASHLQEATAASALLRQHGGELAIGHTQMLRRLTARLKRQSPEQRDGGRGR